MRSGPKTKVPNPQEAKQPNAIRLKYTYTPESPEMKAPSNLIFQEMQKDGWLISVRSGTQRPFEHDINRGILLNHISYKNRSKLLPAAVKKFVKEAYPHLTLPKHAKKGKKKKAAERLKSEASALVADYHQGLTSLPSKALAYSFSTAVAFQPQERKEDLFHAGGDIYFRTENEGFEYRDSADCETIFYIPGRIEVAHRRDSQGFRITDFGFSNKFLRSTVLEARSEEGAFTPQERRVGIRDAHLEEIETLLAASRDPKIRHILLEIQRLCRRGLIDFSKPEFTEISRQFGKVYVLTRKFLNNENEDAAAWAAVALELSLCSPFQGLVKKIKSPEELYAQAGTALEEVQDKLGASDPRLTLLHSLRQQITQAQSAYPEATLQLAGILWRTKDFIEKPEAQAAAYAQVYQAVNKTAWGKIIAGTLLSLVCASVLALCCATGIGALALPVAAATLSYAIPAGSLVSGVGLFGSLSFSYRSVAKKGQIRRIADALNEILCLPPPAPTKLPSS